jgi:hypothetical protein
MRNTASAAKAVQMLDLLTEFFQGGANWIRGDFHDGDGGYCLVGAMISIRHRHKLYGDPTRYYLVKAFVGIGSRDGLMRCNDACQSWDELLRVITDARRLALADLAKRAPLKQAA